MHSHNGWYSALSDATKVRENPAVLQSFSLAWRH